jgi:hypothetical protein
MRTLLLIAVAALAAVVFWAASALAVDDPVAREVPAAPHPCHN